MSKEDQMPTERSLSASSSSAQEEKVIVRWVKCGFGQEEIDFGWIERGPSRMARVRA